ncbi:hypothetical protein Tco_0627427 [Tanacetum coccineum]|uniref:Transposase (putative) gypsy type domain-containing protein n=1 Tax=Tanacetum coccineum TaxID=301880 RepID=A0ABQ4WMH7_9ASTR
MSIACDVIACGRYYWTQVSVFLVSLRPPCLLVLLWRSVGLIRLPLSTFLVDILRHFRINISQLSVIESAKVSHFEILCRVYGIVPTVRLFWYEFACPARFPWHTAKNVTKDPAPVAGDFNAQDYATLVAHPSPFRKFPEEFLCLVGPSRYYTLDEGTYPWFLDRDEEEMDLFAFIQTANPTKVKVVKRERNEDEPLLLQTTVGRTVPLLLVAPDRAESELEASVDKLFDEGGSGNQTDQGDSMGGAGEASHPPKTLRKDHGAPSGVSVGGKSVSAVQRLLVGAQNPEVGVAALPTLPLVTSSVSVTPEHEGEGHTDSVTNLRTIGAPQRFVISSDSSHHSGSNIAEAKVDSFTRTSITLMTVATSVTSTVDPATTVKEKFVESSVFGDGSSSGGGADHTVDGFSDLTGSGFIVGGIRTVISLDVDLQKVYVPQWSITNGSRLDDGRVASQMSISAEVRMRAEYNIIERRRLNSVVEDKNSLLNARDEEIENLKARLLVKEAEAPESHPSLAESLQVQNYREKVTTYENFIDQLKKFQDEKMQEVNKKFDKLCADFVEMALHLEEKFYPHLLTTISGRRWLLTHGVELAIAKCLNSTEYLSALKIDCYDEMKQTKIPNDKLKKNYHNQITTPNLGS